MTQQDAKHQSEFGIIVTPVSKRIQFNSLYGKSSNVTTGQYSCHFFGFLQACFQRVPIENYWLKDKQCTYNVILRLVRATVFRVEKQYVLHIVSVCV